MRSYKAYSTIVFGLFLSVNTGSANADPKWQVSRTTGEVWIGSQTAQPVALNNQTALNPGAQIRTGANGRVLISRGEETIMIAPNTQLSLPKQASGRLNTTILQRFGTVLLSVNKKNVKHFSVETPYLAAVVKGTKFLVTVTNSGARVQVTQGAVEVQDLDTGEVALVRPGQFASTAALLGAGLQLGGNGKMPKIKHMSPRSARVLPASPKAPGLNIAPGLNKAKLKAPKAGNTRLVTKHNNKIRINAAVGTVKINFSHATNGLVRSANLSSRSQEKSGKTKSLKATTYWSGNDNSNANGIGNNNTNTASSNSANGNGNGNGNCKCNKNENGNGNGKKNGKSKNK